MRTSAENAALSAVIHAATSDADPGYPYGAAFIPWQEWPQTNRVLWRYLHEGRPAVIVGADDNDMLVEPIRTGRFGRLRNELFRRIAVEISYPHRALRRWAAFVRSEPKSAGTLCNAEHLSSPEFARQQ
jgi:hypothetical protein